jgi:hypothetical protein
MTPVVVDVVALDRYSPRSHFPLCAGLFNAHWFGIAEPQLPSPISRLAIRDAASDRLDEHRTSVVLAVDRDRV